MNDAHIDLMIRYLKNEASTADRRILEEWMRVPENRLRFEEIKKSWEVAADLHRDFVPDEGKAWDSIQRRLVAGKTDAGSAGIWPALVRAAAVILAIVTFTWLGLHLTRETDSGDQMLTELATTSFADSVQLSDGTVVWLNKQTRIRFPQVFEGHDRRVFLEGEAFFEVAADERKPFIIETPSNEIRVLGTSFNLKETEGISEITVVSGKVSFSEKNDPANLAYLEAGQMAAFDLNKRVIRTAGMDPNALFWRTGRLVFRNAGLTEITTALSGYYGEAIQLQVEHPHEYTLTTEFERQSLSEIIEIICLTLDLEYEKNAHGFVLKE